MAGSQSRILHAPEREGDVKHSLASTEKLRAAGFTPEGNFDDGLNATVDFFRNRVSPEPCPA